MVHVTSSLAKRRFHGLMRPMILKSSVRTSKKESGQAKCLSEMSRVMSCWKKANFDDRECEKEIKAFVACCERAGKETRREDGIAKRYDTDELNAQMRKFVWAR